MEAQLYPSSDFSFLDLSIRQRRIIFTILFYGDFTKTEKPNDVRFTITIKKYSELWKVSEKTVLIQFSNLDYVFRKGKFLHKEEEEGYNFVISRAQIFTYLQYNIGEKELVCSFHEDIQKYITFLSKTFPRDKFTQLRFVNGIYIYKFIDICLYTRLNNPFTITKEALYDVLFIDESYKSYAKFKQNVLTPALEFIKKTFGINITVSEAKAGTKVIGFIFIYTEFK